MKKNKLSKINKKYKVFHKFETIFRKWLHDNIEQFKHTPISNGIGGYYFDGITKCVNLTIDFSRPDAMLIFDDAKTKKNYDYYSIQYIGNEKYNPLKGFYDADRTDSIYTYYDTYEELIISEICEPILEYCNNYFKESNSLYIIDYDGSTEAFIAPRDETQDTGKLKMLRRLKQNPTRDIKYLKYNLLTQT